jgi:twitching motility protein PilT
MTFDELVTAAGSRGASDIHLRANHVPLVRIDGTLERWSTVAPLSAADLEGIAVRLLPPVHQERLATKLEVDVAWQAPGVGRVRASIFRQRGTIGVSMRLIPSDVPSLETLGLPPSVVGLAEESRGLVLVTGATGSGKSTTLAALVDLINRTRALHISRSRTRSSSCTTTTTRGHTARSRIRHARVSLGLAQRAASGPDVILIGEMRDMETIETALVAAETGHLVLSTLHTLDAPETVNRIVSVFPPHQQGQIRHQLSRVLRAAVSQRLMPRADGRGRVLAAEVLINTAFVQDCIADPEKTAASAMPSSRADRSTACRASIRRSSACASRVS